MNVRPEYDFKVIGSNLKRLRQANGLSVEEVREYMQLGTVQSIYKWERGDGLPQADSLLALMQLYGASRVETITEESNELSSSYFLWFASVRMGAQEKRVRLRTLFLYHSSLRSIDLSCS